MDVQDGRRVDAATVAEREIVSFVRRRYDKLRGTERGEDYFALLYQLVDHEPSRAFAVDLAQGLEDGDERAFKFLERTRGDESLDLLLRVVSAIVRRRWKRSREARSCYTGYTRAPKAERQPTPHHSRVRVPQSRPRERRPGSARRTRTSTARQSAGDSSPPGEPPPPRRRAGLTYACLTREQRGEE